MRKLFLDNSFEEGDAKPMAPPSINVNSNPTGKCRDVCCCLAVYSAVGMGGGGREVLILI